MREQINEDAERDSGGMLMEDFIATCPTVYVACGGHYYECTAEQRGGAIWLVPDKAVAVTPGETVDLCCPHPTGLYRFKIDILEADPDRLIATRSTEDPMGMRVSIRGRINLSVNLTPCNADGAPTLSGRTHNLGRSGMLVELSETIDIGTMYTSTLALSEAEILAVEAEVVRAVRPDDDSQPTHFGLQFRGVPVDVQRTLLTFILNHADLSQ